MLMNPQQSMPSQVPQSAPQQPVYDYSNLPGAQSGPQPHKIKKQLFMLFGGVALVLILLLWLVFGTGSTGGQTDMRASVQNTADSIGILDAYQQDVQFSGTKNDLALALIILRGNYQNLNELYKTTYNPKASFSNSPKPDETSATKLDEAKRDNRLDSEIITTLEPKVAAAQSALKRAKANFSSTSSLEVINKADQDYTTVLEILADRR